MTEGLLHDCHILPAFHAWHFIRPSVDLEVSCEGQDLSRAAPFAAQFSPKTDG